MSKIVIWTSMLVATNFWSYIYCPRLRIYTQLLFLFYLVVIFFKRPVIERRNSLDKIVVWTIFTIMICFIPAYIDYNQNIIDSLLAASSLSSGLMVYFALRATKASEVNLIKNITIFCFIWVLIEIGQQFTYPTFWFSERYLTYGFLIERMGLVRFYLLGVDFLMLIFAYWASKVLINENDHIIISKFYFNLRLPLFLLFMAGLLCYLSRKHILVCILTVILPFIPTFHTNIDGKRRNCGMGFVFIVILLSSLFFQFSGAFSEMNSSAVESQGEGEDFIRYLSAKYYLFDFSDSLLYPIFGAGIPTGHSALSNKIENAENMFGQFFGFYQADVGIIGYYSKFGLLGVSAIVAFVVYFLKNWKYINLWYKLFFVQKLLLIIFDFWAIWQVGMTVYGIFLYMLDVNIKNNKKIAV